MSILTHFPLQKQQLNRNPVIFIILNIPPKRDIMTITLTRNKDKGATRNLLRRGLKTENFWYILMRYFRWRY